MDKMRWYSKEPGTLHVCIFLSWLQEKKKKGKEKKNYYKVHVVEKYKFNIKRIITIEMSI